MNFQQRWEDALRGDLAPLALAQGTMTAPEKAASMVLFSLASGVAPPTPSSLAEVSSSRGLRLRALRAVLDDDLPTLRECLEAQAQRQVSAQDRNLTERWLALMTGAPLPATTEPLDATARLTTSVQTALDLLEQGDVAAATRTARHVSRMARSDGFVFHEYLASLVLARVRRHGRKPHLATRILQALDQVVPAPWRGWLSWERALVAVPLDDAPKAQELTWPATRILARLLDAARAGNMIGFRRAAEEPGNTFAPVRRELAMIVEALDGSAAVAPGTFLAGATNDSPGALAGLSLSSVDPEGRERPGIFVVADRLRCRRVLAAGVPLLDLPPERRIEAPFRLSQGKPYRMLAELATAGAEGMSTEDLFERVYGFRYLPDRHGSVFRMLLSRTRELLPEAAEVQRVGDRLALRVDQPLVFPDPRCAQELEALLLQSLAERGGRATARELAETVGVSLRTVQLSLKGLLEEGACEATGKGRAAAYQLEDTTFWEPTLDRLAPRGLLP